SARRAESSRSRFSSSAKHCVVWLVALAVAVLLAILGLLIDASPAFLPACSRSRPSLRFSCGWDRSDRCRGGNRNAGNNPPPVCIRERANQNTRRRWPAPAPRAGGPSYG